MHDHDKLLRAALMTAHRFARGGYADQGFVDDAPDSVLMQEVYGNPITGETVPMSDQGIQLSDPMRKAVENYAGNVGQAFRESGEYAKQGLENTVSDKGPLYNVSGPLQYMLGSAGQVFSPLTGAAMSAGQGATEVTGNPEFGNRVEFLAGLADPTHVGAIKNATRIAHEMTPFAAVASMAPKMAEASAPARELSPLGFYSHGAETAANLQQAKGTPQQYRSMLEKAGVKPAEMEGFDEAFADRPSVTRDEVAQHFKENMPQVEETVLGQKMTPAEIARLDELDKKFSQQGGFTPEEKIEYNALYQKEGELANSQTKFGQYTLPGGENYREVLLKLPEKSFGRDDPRVMQEALMAYNEKDIPRLTDGQWKMLQARAARRNGEALEQPFQSSHWDDPNVLAHLRMADRTGPNGEKILHVEEIQSDWGQKGKKEGFATKYNPEDIKEIDPANITSERRRNEFWNFETPTGAIDVPRNSRWPTIEAARQHILDNMKPTGVPTAPYVTNTQAWTDLALKRALREAAEGGYDKLVWTPGAEQAKRYKLSNQVNAVTYDPAQQLLQAEGPRGELAFAKGNIAPEKIADYIGKEAAERLLAEKPNQAGYHVLEGEGLDVGGSGMKGYYDKIVPNQLSKLVKKLDPSVKVGPTDVMLPPKAGIGHNNPPFEAPGITITPKMRENILKGQTAFKRGGAIPFGPEAAQRAVRIAKQQAGRR